jgi:hypothetical protein
MDQFEAVEVLVKDPQTPVSESKEIDLGEDKTVKVVQKENKTETQDTSDDGVELLRRQLEEKKREADEAKRQKAEAERIAQQREQEVRTYQNQAQDSQHTAFVNAIASFERDAEMLEKAYAEQLSAGDYIAAAKVQRQMAQIESKLSQLHQGREALEERQRYQEAQPAYEQPRVQQVEADPFEQRIQHLHPTAQQWVRQHPEYVTNPRMNSKMVETHWRALDEGYTANSPDYFSYLESELLSPAQSQPKVQRTAMAAAPVSRSNSSVIRGQSGVTVTLTPAERDHAASMDMTDEEYAANKLYYINKGELRG